MATLWSPLSVITIASVGFTSKLFLRSGLCSITVNGLDILTSVIDNPDRRAAGQGVVTATTSQRAFQVVAPLCAYSNKKYRLDDPLVWGILPARYYFRSYSTRWALGASDVIFTNPVFSAFFRLGQTFQTFRGAGIYQPSVDMAIEKLNMGHWVHLFSEAKVTQPDRYPMDTHGHAHLPRFKWGIGRILMESKIPPVVIPMWITGFDQLMPEGRQFPSKYFPRVPAKLGATFGQPVKPDELRQALSVMERDTYTATPDRSERLAGWLGEEARRQHPTSVERLNERVYNSLIRQKVTAVIQQNVEVLGRAVSGDSLRLTP